MLEKPLNLNVEIKPDKVILKWDYPFDLQGIDYQIKFNIEIQQWIEGFGYKHYETFYEFENKFLEINLPRNYYYRFRVKAVKIPIFSTSYHSLKPPSPEQSEWTDYYLFFVPLLKDTQPQKKEINIGIILLIIFGILILFKRR